ncbi:DUF726-domain-containing protein [Clavulina sp. PMI_390]|nr:DUF726-domain-containing protein [Clavulina sp. PMI_390]
MPELGDEHKFALAIAAKATALYPPFDSPSVLPWWTSLGSVWLQVLCERLSIQTDHLPDEPSVEGARGLSSSFSDAYHPEVASILLTSTLLAPSSIAKDTSKPVSLLQKANPFSNSTPSKSKADSEATPQFAYNASTRAFIARTLDILDISYRHLLAAEVILSHELYEKFKEAELKSRGEAIRKEKEDGWGGSWGRWAATAGGVTLGGVVIGLTGGLAAPALLPLLPFLSAGTAPIILGSVLGLAGGGLTGYRVRRRWGGVEKFEFVELLGPGEGEGGEDVKQIEAKKAPSVIAAMLIPGIQVKSVDESLDSSKQCRDLFAPYHQDLYVVSHSPEVMLTTGKTLHGWVMSQLYSKAGAEILKRTAFNAVMAAVAMPLTIYKTTGMVVDNQWVQGTDKARKAGLLLAEVLREKVHGTRPVILIGSSLGAMALFEALLSLATTSSTSGSSDPEPPLVDTAIFISLPQAPTRAQWKAVRGVVGRRVVNAYCKSDFVLAGVGRLHEVLGGGHLGGIGGLAATPKDIVGIENIDLEGVLDGHFDISEKMPVILERIGMDR